MRGWVQVLSLAGVLVMALAALSACGGGSDDGGNGGEDGGADDAGNAAQQLFVSVGCAACHGDEGQGDGTNPRTVLAETRMILMQFEARVRNGRGSAMPGYTVEQISDAQINELWEWLRNE